MRRLLLITGLLVALSGLIRSVDAQQTTPVVGYGSTSNNGGEIYLIDLENGAIAVDPNTSLPYTPISVGHIFQGLAIDSTGNTLYGTTGTGELYSIDITGYRDTGLLPSPGTAVFIGAIRQENGDPLPSNVPGKSTESMDFNFNGTELWVMDLAANQPTTWSINITPDDGTANDGIATPVQGNTPKVNAPGINDAVRAMAVETTNLVWIANDNLSKDFQSVNTDMSSTDSGYPVNVTHKGFLNTVIGIFPPGPDILGMDGIADGVLYGLSDDGGIYRIDQASGLLTLVKDTNHTWLGLAAAAPEDNDEDGFSSPDDCDDNNDTIYPDAPELCDGIDNNCNGVVDDITNTYWVDGDGDGFGDPVFPLDLIACSTPTGYSDNSDDCDDADATVYTGATELCDGKEDNDCDGVVPANEIDNDGDGFSGCEGDCDDSDTTVYPGATDVPENSIDEDCNGSDLTWAEKIGTFIDTINSLDPGVFNKPKDQEKLTKTLKKTIKEIEKGKNKDALKKLNKVLEKTDGCALRGTPDTKGKKKKNKEDSIQDCNAQAQIYPLVLNAIALLNQP